MGVLYHIIFPMMTSNECQWDKMYKNRSIDGKLNVCGSKIASLRKMVRPRMSQRMLADWLQLAGLDLDKNAISKIEAGQRFVTDIELNAFARLFGVSVDELLGFPET
mgnify:CR=1 FL=1